MKDSWQQGRSNPGRSIRDTHLKAAPSLSFKSKNTTFEVIRKIELPGAFMSQPLNGTHDSVNFGNYPAAHNCYPETHRTLGRPGDD